MEAYSLLTLTSAVRLLVQRGHRVGARDQAGNTPLHLAAEAGNKEAARVLVHSGAPSQERNSAGLTPLHVAAKQGHAGVAAVLLGGLASGAVDPLTSVGARSAAANTQQGLSYL